MLMGRLWIMIYLLVVSGCSAHAEELRTIVAADLPAQRVTDQGMWESMPWVGTEAVPWLDYPGGVTLRVEHSLGYVPSVVLVYLSFRSDGSATGLASGDLAHVVSVDGQFVQIKNATRSDMYARIVVY